MVAVHMAVEASPAACRIGGCARGGLFSRVRKVLKSAWEVEAMSPGVADHITPGIAARAGLVTVHVAI